MFVSSQFLKFLLILVNTLVQCQELKEKSYTISIVGMEELLDIERILIQSIEQFTVELQIKVEKLKNLAAQLREENQKSLNNSEGYLSNPLNGYALIRRMHYDWPHIELFMSKPVGEAHIQVIQDFRPHMPSATDLKEACEALHRLQLTYDLTAADMAQGLLNGKQYEVQLKSIDLYFMGHNLFVEEKHYHSALWTFSAIMSYENSDYNEIIDFEEEKNYVLYAETLVKQGRHKDALIPIDHAYELKPLNADLLKRRNDIRHLSSTSENEAEPFLIHEPSPYELGCRGNFSNTSLQLYCLYNTTSSIYTKLAPFKMEILSLEPYMVLYHNVIFDNEIAELKSLAQPKLKRAAVYSEDTTLSKVVKTRTAKSSGFPDSSSNAAKQINRRIADMTGFDVSKSEVMQVMNYGLGGHYEIHYDFFNVSDTNELVRDEGDRIATVLFYLSDVEQGGATVFPNIDVAVFPRKGSAIVWYNLANDLEGDWRTLHAACPVLVGSKWVSNKWIRSKDQMFRRLCYK